MAERTSDRVSERTNGKTKIKCKWKFIAPGDRRRFRTFKYFINFLLASILCGSQERYRMKGRRVSEKKWLQEGWKKNCEVERALAGVPVDFFFFQRRRTYRYRNVIKTSKWLWIAPRVTSHTSAFHRFGHFFPLPTSLSTGASFLGACFVAIAKTSRR